MKIKSGVQPGPRRILLYGQDGVGKSSWAAQAPRPIFLDVEDGLNDIDCDKTEKLTSYGDVTTALSWLATNQHPYRSVVLDTWDWLERFILEDVAREAGKPAFSLIKFGEGDGPALKKAAFILDQLDALRKHRGMGIILLAHARIVKFEAPGAPAYNCYEPDSHKSILPHLKEWCDEIFFASYRVFTTSEDAGFGRKRAIGTGGGERFIRTEKTAAVAAKNRIRGLPEELPMDWSAYAQYIPRPAAPAPVAAPATPPAEPTGDISGVVVNGSSKITPEEVFAGVSE